MDQIKLAAMLVIGDEILSGRTQDKNVYYLANCLTEFGIDLKEVRVISDEEKDIIAAVNDLRARHDFVFTSGGIGPTHDDITAESIAKAFDLPISVDERAVALMQAHSGDNYLNEARLRMARIPQSAELLANRISGAPGFRVENVFVMAGVPKIMEVMLEEALKQIEPGKVMMSRSVSMAGLPESGYAAGLGEIEAKFVDVKFGSYPAITPTGQFDNSIVIRSRDADGLEAGVRAVEALGDATRARLGLAKPGN